jgi:hypothetical protein
MALTTYPKWRLSVERELIRLGMFVFDARSTLDENEEWFEDQFDAGAFAEITAQEWINHHAD